MDRRHFLKTSAPALAAMSLGITGCNDDTPVTAALNGAVSFPQITFITRDPTFTDYRPAVDVTSQNVLFERTPFPNPDAAATTVLYIASSIASPNPGVGKFLPPPPANPGATYPFSQTRPDWSWVTGQIAFTGSPTDTTGPFQVHLVTSGAGDLRVVANTGAHIYPIWTSDGTELVTYDNSDTALPRPPVSALIRPDGSVVVANLNGADANGVQVFGGFAAPKPGAPTRIAFAGQPALANWGDSVPGTVPVYNQDNNYVFLNTSQGSTFSSAPLEPAASIVAFDATHQGRAPYWSPDGNYLVFESSRAGGYAIFLVNVGKGTPPQQLTDTTYWAQHAKFFPSGKELVFTALQVQDAGGRGPRGIATIDITAYL